MHHPVENMVSKKKEEELNSFVRCAFFSVVLSFSH